MDIVYDPNFLEHYGVGHLDGGHSGRYPWGSTKRTAQRYRRGSRVNPARFAKKSEEDQAAIKAKIAKDPKSLYRNSDLFTTSELQNAYTRLNTMQSLRNLSDQKLAQAKKTADVVLGYGNTTLTAVQLVDKIMKAAAK